MGDVLLDAEYSKVHLIAHSAGAYMVDGMSRKLEAQRPETVTQVTFLDAFTALAWLGNFTDHHEAYQFGESADWAEHYRHDGVLPLTNEAFDHAINIDVTALAPLTMKATDLVGGISGHSWPWEWYLKTSTGVWNPLNDGWGHDRSLELGYAVPLNSERNKLYYLGVPGDANQDGVFDSLDLLDIIAAGKYETGKRATWREGD